jgi:hypothetical protein
VTFTYLECAAVRTDFQGAVLTEVEPLDEDGRPVTLGRYLLEVLLSDISERPRVPITRAVIARENARSLRLCTRIGLTDERSDPDERFVNGSDAWRRSRAGSRRPPNDCGIGASMICPELRRDRPLSPEVGGASAP